MTGMDLISRKALIDDLCQDREEGTFDFTEKQAEAADKVVRYVNDRIEAQPSVPAVPLDKLVKWMAERYAVPCRAFDEPEGIFCGSCCEEGISDVECWKRYFTKWMEEHVEKLREAGRDTAVEAQRDYEAASDMRDNCEHYEPTYNPEDGSM